MKRFLFCLISLVVLLFVGFSTYYVLRNNESVAYTVGDKETIYMNLGETIASPVIHENKAKGSSVTITLSNDNVVYDATRDSFEAVNTGSTTVTCVPSNAKFNSINFTITVGDGGSSPFYIRNEEDLRKIGVGDWRLSSNYELVSDITLSKPFTPIGSETSPFLGTLFGGEVLHTIQNININSDMSVAGVFGAIGSSARIERVNFKDVKIKGNYSYAGLIAGINNGFIGQCKVNGEIENSSQDGVTGGVCGLNKSLGSFAQISLCTITSNLKANKYVGGIVGQNLGGAIDNCISTTDVDMANGSIFGGIAGDNAYSSLLVDGEMKYINAKFVNNITFLNRIGTSGEYYTIIGQTLALRNIPTTLSYFDSLFTCSSNDFTSIGLVTGDNDLKTNTSTTVGYYKNISASALADTLSFTSKSGSSWNFDEFWSVANGSNLFIDYDLCAGSYQSLPEASSIKTELSSTQAVKDALALIRDYPYANLEYKITKNMSIDLENETFAPIGNEETPFVGKIIAQDGVTVMIRNFKITQENGIAGLFGKIQGNETVIQGITISGFTNTGKIVGGLVGQNEGAIIENCAVDSFSLITTGAAGAIAGINNGEITSSYSNKSGGYSVITVNDVQENEASIGTVAGINLGKISQVESLMVNVNVYSETSKPIYVGGIAGKNSGKIDSCSLYNLNVSSTKNSGDAFVGGIVGSLDSGTVSYSFVSNASISSSELGEKSYVGGISGTVHENGIIESCIFDSGTIFAKKSGGLVGQLYGKIEKCAVNSTAIIEGYYVGGLACDCYGSIRNSYTLANLNGSSVEAGFVTYLNDGSSIKYCYNYCSYTGEGKGYCETETSFRNKKANREFLNNIVVGENVGGGGLFGDLFVNEVIQRDKNKKVAIQTRFGYKKGTFVIVSEEVALGSSAFAEFVSNGFDSNIWNVNTQSGEEQNYLKLNDLPEIPTGDEEESE